MLPEELIVLEEITSSIFPKIVYFESNKDAQQKNQMVAVNRTDNSFAFTTTFRLHNDGTREILTLKTTWSTKAQQAGDYSASVRATTRHSESNEDFRLKEETANFTIVSDAPLINSLDVPNRSHSLGLNHSEWYVPPDKDIEVRCQVTCPTGVQNVTLYYSVWPSNIWSSNAMTFKSNNEWIGVIPGQSEGTLALFYIEAFSSAESAIEDGRPCRFLDLKMLEHKVMIDTAIILTVILVGCLILFAMKKRKMSELL